MTNPADNFPPYGPPPYTMPGNPTAEPFYPTIWPPPIQGLAKAYLTPRMAPIPVATRLPQPGQTKDTVNGFIRIEAAGGHLRKDEVFFDCSVVISSYAPNNQESQAEINCMKAVAHAGNAQGRLIVHPSLQRPWFVTYSHVFGLPVKKADPLVNMVRFQAMCTWRIAGSSDPLNEPNDSLQ